LSQTESYKKVFDQHYASKNSKKQSQNATNYERQNSNESTKLRKAQAEPLYINSKAFTGNFWHYEWLVYESDRSEPSIIIQKPK
jgi:hypothetical protein